MDFCSAVRRKGREQRDFGERYRCLQRIELPLRTPGGGVQVPEAGGGEGQQLRSRSDKQEPPLFLSLSLLAMVSIELAFVSSCLFVMVPRFYSCFNMKQL